jgi:hypothetical protein
VTQTADGDADGLPDAWENLVVGNIDSDFLGDTPFNLKNLFAYATSMQDGTYRTYPQVEVVSTGGQSFFQMTFRRRRGLEAERFIYTPQRLDAALQPLTDTAPWTTVGTPTVQWDGTGTESVTLRSPVPIGPEASYVRLSVTVAP